MKKLDVVDFQRREAIESYSRCPLTVTVVRHAEEMDDSEFDCVHIGLCHNFERGAWTEETVHYASERIFIVPKQKIDTWKDPDYGMFYLVRVVPRFTLLSHRNEREFYLIGQMNGRAGFLVRLSAVDHQSGQEEEEQEKLAA